MKKLSTIPAPALAGVVREVSTKAAIAQVKNCYLNGANMIDLHLSCLEDRSVAALKQIIHASPLPVLALNYNQRPDWTRLGLTEEERIASFRDAIEAGAAGIDMQGYTFHDPSRTGFCGEDRYSFTQGNPKEVVTDPAIIEKQAELIRQVHDMGAEVLLSCHPGIPMSAQQVVDLALFLQERGPDIIKIVTRAETQEHMQESILAMIQLKRAVKTPVSYHANGKAGMLSRILNPILGGQIAFCVDGYNANATMEQIDLRSARQAVDSIRRLTFEG